MNISINRIIEELSKPEAYPHRVSEVQVIQTHISVIFITDERVYKVKKPVDFGFLDFTTLDKRQHFCFEELALNRRLSPEIYLDVVPVTEEGGALKFGGRGKAVEYAVMMSRLPEDRILTNLLERGEADELMMKRIAERISEFHLSAETSREITEIGGTAAVEFNTEEDFTQIEPYIGLTLLPGTFDLLTDYTRTFREVNSGLFAERETGGWIRDGHGDLHTQHICMDNGIQIFDCIEFNQRFRYSDILCDAAFLTMDLERLGHPELAAAYTEAYLSAAGQEGTKALYNFYTCYRAIVRGKVEGFRFHDPSVSRSEAAQARDNAADFMLLAERYARTLYPPTLFLMCGLMGSGKSSAAEGLAGKLDMSILSSDRVRKELAGIDPDEGRKVPFDSDIYSQEMTQRTYDRMNTNAAGILKTGGSVVLDATFTDPVRRIAAFHTARKTGARPILLYLEADEETLRTRLRKRAKGVSISDGREDILGDQRKAFIPPDELSDEHRLTLKASGMTEEIVRSAYRRALYTS